MALPKNGEAYIFYTSLVDALDTTAFKVNPTIAAGDFQISKDGGSFANLATLPVVAPAGGIPVRISLSAVEMTADKVMIQGIDQAGVEWLDITVFIDVPTGDIDTVVDLLEGDHWETYQNIKIFKKGTSVEILNKDITGSLLTPGITITTEEP